MYNVKLRLNSAKAEAQASSLGLAELGNIFNTLLNDHPVVHSKFRNIPSWIIMFFNIVTDNQGR